MAGVEDTKLAAVNECMQSAGGTLSAGARE
jgi:hypothetical protein